MVTSPLFQPLAFGAGAAVPVTVGACRSILIGPTVTGVAVLPPLSFAAPVTIWPAGVVSSVRVTFGPHSAMPEPPLLSEQVNVTSTGPLFQPNVLAAGVRLPLIVGASVSEIV